MANHILDFLWGILLGKKYDFRKDMKNKAEVIISELLSSRWNLQFDRMLFAKTYFNHAKKKQFACTLPNHDLFRHDIGFQDENPNWGSRYK